MSEQFIGQGSFATSDGARIGMSPRAYYFDSPIYVGLPTVGNVVQYLSPAFDGMSPVDKVSSGSTSPVRSGHAGSFYVLE